MVVIPLALLSKKEIKQSIILIEDKSTQISFAVLFMLAFLYFCFFFLLFDLPIQLKVSHKTLTCLHNNTFNTFLTKFQHKRMHCFNLYGVVVNCNACVQAERCM